LAIRVALSPYDDAFDLFRDRHDPANPDVTLAAAARAAPRGRMLSGVLQAHKRRAGRWAVISITLEAILTGARRDWTNLWATGSIGMCPVSIALMRLLATSCLMKYGFAVSPSLINCRAGPEMFRVKMFDATQARCSKDNCPMMHWHTLFVKS
jgi:hypothetical protein